MRYRHVRVVVVGAGVNGLCTAWHLASALPGAEIVVIDAHKPGHNLGSSHGAERIIRTSYETTGWVEAARRARNELWPRLEESLERRLVTPGPAVFWGPEDGPLPAYADATRDAGARVRQIDPGRARREFPGMTFVDAERVLVDDEAGILAAADTLDGLRAWLSARGVTLLRGRVHRIDEDPTGVLVRSDQDLVRAQAVVVAAGPWVTRLYPALLDSLTVVRQDVGYWASDVVAGRSPAWVHLGRQGLHYGLPTLAGGSMKAAFHRTAAATQDDPERPREPDNDALGRVRAHLVAWFDPAPGTLLAADTCIYTNAPQDSFRIYQPSPRIQVVSACSGHAFKLAPLTGEAAARWAVGVAG